LYVSHTTARPASALVFELLILVSEPSYGLLKVECGMCVVNLVDRCAVFIGKASGDQKQNVFVVRLWVDVLHLDLYVQHGLQVHFKVST
jgi:hypothetical protein